MTKVGTESNTYRRRRGGGRVRLGYNSFQRRVYVCVCVFLYILSTETKLLLLDDRQDVRDLKWHHHPPPPVQTPLFSHHLFKKKEKKEDKKKRM